MTHAEIDRIKHQGIRQGLAHAFSEISQQITEDLKTLSIATQFAKNTFTSLESKIASLRQLAEEYRAVGKE